MRRDNAIAVLGLAVWLVTPAGCRSGGVGDETPVVAVRRTATPVVLSEDGGWCWFQDPRAVIHDGTLWVGSVALGARDAARAGDIELLSYGFASGEVGAFELADRFDADDHAAPALHVRPDGRVQAVYAPHGGHRWFTYRVTVEPGDPSAWTEPRTFEPAVTTSHSVCYSNVIAVSDEGLVYNFFRGDHFNPNAAVSEDDGETWRHLGRLIGGPGRPYVRYVGNGVDAVHFAVTDQHPRDADNSLYHGYLRRGMLHRSDGTVLGLISLDEPVPPHDLSRVFQGTPEDVAWCSDIVLDADGHPVIGFSVQHGGAGAPRGEGGGDLRFHYARWDGERWHEHFVAFAGQRLYPGEDDYSGLISIDPTDPGVVYFCTDADPVTGEPLVSAATGARQYELFRGVTGDGGATWAFEALTADSAQANLRPIVVAGEGRKVLLWLNGRYTTFTDYEQRVLMIELP